MQETLDAIKEYNAKHGPFASVVGFSQGGCLAAVLAALSDEYNTLGGDVRAHTVLVLELVVPIQAFGDTIRTRLVCAP